MDQTQPANIQELVQFTYQLDNLNLILDRKNYAILPYDHFFIDQIDRPRLQSRAKFIQNIKCLPECFPMRGSFYTHIALLARQGECALVQRMWNLGCKYYDFEMRQRTIVFHYQLQNFFSFLSIYLARGKRTYEKSGFCGSWIARVSDFVAQEASPNAGESNANPTPWRRVHTNRGGSRRAQPSAPEPDHTLLHTRLQGNWEFDQLKQWHPHEAELEQSLPDHDTCRTIDQYGRLVKLFWNEYVDLFELFAATFEDRSIPEPNHATFRQLLSHMLSVIPITIEQEATRTLFAQHCPIVPFTWIRFLVVNRRITMSEYDRNWILAQPVHDLWVWFVTEDFQLMLRIFQSVRDVSELSMSQQSIWIYRPLSDAETNQNFQMMREILHKDTSFSRWTDDYTKEIARHFEPYWTQQIQSMSAELERPNNFFGQCWSKYPIRTQPLPFQMQAALALYRYTNVPIVEHIFQEMSNTSSDNAHPCTYWVTPFHNHVFLPQQIPQKRGAALCIDTGRGKTLTIFLTILLRLLESKAWRDEQPNKRFPILIIAPTTVVDHWRSDMVHHVPEFQDRICTVLNLPEWDKLKRRLSTFDILVVTQDAFPKDRFVRELSQYQFHTIVIDEFHNIDSSSKTAYQIPQIQSSITYLVSATPVLTRNSIVYKLFGLPHFTHSLHAFYASTTVNITSPPVDHRVMLTSNVVSPSDDPTLSRFLSDVLPVIRRISNNKTRQRAIAQLYAFVRLGNYNTEAFLELYQISSAIAEHQSSRQRAHDHTDNFQPTEEASLCTFQSVDDPCLICLNPLTQPLQTNCRHVFCTNCLKEWFTQNHRHPCPLCREHIHHFYLPKYQDPDQEEKESKEQKEQEQEQTEQKGSSSSSSSSSSTEEKKGPSFLRSSHPAKMARVQRIVQQIYQRDRNVKTVILTEFRHLVSICAEALRSLGIQVMTLGVGVTSRHSAQEAIRSFKEDPNISVLVTYHGYIQNGVDFCMVNHLILMDLPLERKRFVQWAGRVDRIGQKGSVYVHLMYYERTPEEYLAHRYMYTGRDSITQEVEYKSSNIPAMASWTTDAARECVNMICP